MELQSALGRIQQYQQLIKSLNETNENLKVEINKTETRKHELLRKLHESGRDPIGTSRADDGDLQPDIVHKDLGHFRDQELNAASDNIFQLQIRVNPSLRDERKHQIAIIKSILSQRLLVEKLDNDYASDLWNSIQALFDSTDELPVAAERKMIIKLGVMTVFEADHNVAAPAPDFDSVVKAIQHDLLIRDIQLDELNAHIRRPFDYASSLVARIHSMQPSGCLWLAKQGAQFDPSLHEAQVGCDPSGIVQATVFPGFSIGKHQLAPARVYTTPFSQAAQ